MDRYYYSYIVHRHHYTIHDRLTGKKIAFCPDLEDAVAICDSLNEKAEKG